MKPRPYRSVSPRTVLLMRQLIVGSMIAAFLGMLIISVWFGTRLNVFTLKTITITGGETIDHGEVEQKVKDQLAGSYLKIIPKAFAFTYPHEEIVSVINSTPRVKNAQVTKVSGTELRVSFEEYVPYALWCSATDSEKCLFLDDSGYAFSEAPRLKGGSLLRFISIQKEPALHSQAFLAEEYIRSRELVEKFAAAKWFVNRIDIDAAGDAFLSIVEGGEFKVSLKQPADETVSNLLTVLGSESFAHIKPGNFEYIDLRFGSKVFVNEVTIHTAASSTPNTTASSSPVSEAPSVTQASEPIIASEETIAEALAEGEAASGQ